MPFPDGREPDDDRDHGRADEEFAAVVFDEDFVRGARIHEPSAVERLLAAAEARAEAEARARARGRTPDGEYEGEGPGFGPRGEDRDHDPYAAYDVGEEYDEYRDGGHRRFGGHSGRIRWHRPVAWMLALLLGMGMVALAVSAVYRGASDPKDPGVRPPAPTGVEQGAEQSALSSAEASSASPDHSRPVASAGPRTP